MAKIDDLIRASGGSLHQSASVRPGPVGMAEVSGAAQVRDNRKEGLERSKAEFSIPLGKIEPDPGQPRDEMDGAEIERLAESFKSDGQINNITVYWSADSGRYRIVSGESRYRAACRAGWEAIRCTIIDRPTPDEILALQCIENLMRSDLKPIQQARAFRRLLDIEGWNITKLARRMGVSQPSVSQSLRLLDLPDAIQERVTSGELAPISAYHVAKLDDPVAQAEVVEAIMAGDLTRDQTVEIVRDRMERVARSKDAKSSGGKGRGGKPKPRTTSRLIKTRDGCRVTVERKKGLDGVALVEALREALGQAEAEASSSGRSGGS